MLDNLNKNKNPFKVPENYFQNFNAEIMDKLPAKEDTVVKKVPLWKKVVPWTAVAAAFVGVLFLTGVLDRSVAIDPNTAVSDNDGQTSEFGVTLSDDEDIYYAFLEDEVLKARYKEMMYN